MILAVAMMLLTAVFPAKAADFMVDSIAYNIIGEHELEVTSRDVKYSGEVIIPATVVYGGSVYRVTRIGSSAFGSCSDLTYVEIPEGVTEIAENAFYYCGLESIEFPNSLMSIGEYAFRGCKDISNFYIPRNVGDIAKNAFLYCTGVNDFMVSGSNPYYKSVGGVLYTRDMTMLVAYPSAATATSFDIPETVTKLQDFAFHFNPYLIEVTIPESVTWVGGAAFRGCSAITSLDFPDGITHIGSSGFSECSNLTSVHLPASLDTIHNSMCGELPKLAEITIPRNVRCIDNVAFRKSTGIKSIIFEEGSCLDSIGMSAFTYCSSLETFDMPNSVTKIGTQVFGDCSSLKTVHLSESLPIVRASTFWQCESLIESVIPSSVTYVGHNVYSHCSSLKTLKIGDRNDTPAVTEIDYGQTYDCYALEKIELGANVKTLSGHSFADINSLKVFISWGLTPPESKNGYCPFRPEPNSLNATLYVPKAAVETYSTTQYWQDFTNIVAIEDVGDVNVDGFINISDAIALINHLSVDAPVNAPLADVNMDGYINISDAIELINRLLNG